MRLFGKRKEDKLDKNRWMFWRWHDIIINDILYLTRLTLLTTPWFSIKLHWIHREDLDRDLHDHPWPFASFVLRGGYNEVMSPDPINGQIENRTIKWFNYMGTKGAHRITEVRPNTLTLFVTGKKSRDWGFWVPVEDGYSMFVPEEQYVKEHHK